MVSGRQTRTVLSVSSSLYVLSLCIGSSTIRSTLGSVLSPTTHPLRFVAFVIAAFLNAKSLPFAWHVRLVWPMIYQIWVQPTPLPHDALFRPIVTKGCRATLSEIDYNVHKSNSTYFADLDIGRSMLISCLLRKGIRETGQRNDPDPDDHTVGTGSGAPEIARHVVGNASQMVEGSPSRPRSPPSADIVGVDEDEPEPEQEVKDKPRDTALDKEKKPPKKTAYVIALGGVSCSFKREVKPNQEFEIWTRVLSWDRKWMYLVSHMVRAGVVKPDHYSLQPWKTDGRPSFWGRLFGSRSQTDPKQGDRVLEELQRERKEAWNQAVFATSVSKYVIKRGRKTLPPEYIWNRSSLLPPKPDDSDDNLNQDPHAWTWDNVERERQRGWKLAEHFAALDDAIDEVPVSWSYNDEGTQVLGSYQDLFMI